MNAKKEKQKKREELETRDKHRIDFPFVDTIAWQRNEPLKE